MIQSARIVERRKHTHEPMKISGTFHLTSSSVRGSILRARANMRARAVKCVHVTQKLSASARVSTRVLVYVQSYGDSSQNPLRSGLCMLVRRPYSKKEDYKIDTCPEALACSDFEWVQSYSSTKEDTQSRGHNRHYGQVFESCIDGHFVWTSLGSARPSKSRGSFII